MHEFYGMENGKKPGDIVHTSEPKAGGLKKKDFLVFLAFLLLTEGGGAIIGISTADQINTWYKDLVKPSWNPPNWLFGPVWTTLYFLQAVSAFIVWKTIGFKKALPWLLFFTQLALNFAWAPLFFIAHELLWASVESVCQALFILFTITIFTDVQRTAGLLLLPYLAWVTFATYLSFTIWQLNPETEGLWIVMETEAEPLATARVLLSGPA